MLSLDTQFAASIDHVSSTLAGWTVTEIYRRNPEYEARFGPTGPALWKGEIVNRLQYLAEAIATDRPEIFVNSVEWARAAFVARGFTTADVAGSLTALSDTLQEEMPAAIADRCARVIKEGLKVAERPETVHDDKVLQSVFNNADVDGPRGRAYLTHLLERQQDKALDVLLESVKSGRSVAEVFETIIAPAMTEVGRLWHLNEATVADEHYVTTATHNAIALLRTKLPRATPNGKRALATSVGGDLHDVGIRMVADLLESEGWQVECLGANMPTGDLVAHAVDDVGTPQFDLVALSASTGLAVRSMANAVSALREASANGHLAIMVGGGPFAMIPDLWQVVGADGCARCASEAVRVAKEISS